MGVGVNIWNRWNCNAIDQHAAFGTRFNTFNHSGFINSHNYIALPTSGCEGRSETELALCHDFHYTVYTTLYK